MVTLLPDKLVGLGFEELLLFLTNFEWLSSDVCEVIVRKAIDFDLLQDYNCIYQVLTVENSIAFNYIIQLHGVCHEVLIV